jgi:hypothetical protein
VICGPAFETHDLLAVAMALSAVAVALSVNKHKPLRLPAPTRLVPDQLMAEGFPDVAKSQ